MAREDAEDLAQIGRKFAVEGISPARQKSAWRLSSGADVRVLGPRLGSRASPFDRIEGNHETSLVSATASRDLVSAISMNRSD